MNKRIAYPFSEATVRDLVVGEQVLVHGRLFTGRDRLHRYLAQGGRVAVSLRDGCLYHCGPVVLRGKDAWRVTAAGPTTSIRQEPYMAKVIADQGVRVIIGKGGMGAATSEACRTYGCVYLQTVGGAAALLAQCVKQVSDVYLMEEFGPTEGMWDLQVADFPAVVAIDTHGGNLHERVASESRAALDALFHPSART